MTDSAEVFVRRASLLMQQERYDLAETELRRALVEFPEFGLAHSMLAFCFLQRDAFDEATTAAKTGIHLSPDNDYSYYALAQVLFGRKHYPEARQAIEQAIALAPQDADNYAVLARLHVAQDRWSDGLAAANRGLEADPEHAVCVNMRAVCLVKLGHTALAQDTVRETLQRRPNDPLAHANLGWTYLEQRNPDKALEHFREALRLAPELEWAQAGIVEALKSRNIAYRWLFSYFLWLAKLPSQGRWMIVLGGMFGIQYLSAWGKQHPEFQTLVTIVVVLYVIFGLSTWLASPLMNVTLRFHPLGRHALSRDAAKQANWVAAGVGLGLVFLIAYLATNSVLLMWCALVTGLTLPGLSSVFHCESGWPRQTMFAIAAAVFLWGMVSLALLAAVDLSLIEAVPLRQVCARIGLTGIQQFWVVALLSQLAANVLVGQVVRK